ncbi:CaiB/BaiF CoA transferase family protein [Novosphingobium sp.]|uniref:CaiB/BaiF CoA transferase family protein n=1 Tax=Novosphingobium sp. TaxID=1874826 RepID=UPI0038BD605B
MKLSGIRVLDLSSYIPGPYLTMAMADHGATVVKVEAPGGDHTRHIGLKDGPDTVYFRNFNRGKHSIVLNLKDTADHAAFLRLADEADVLVESNRPGVAARLGIDHATLAARNPRLITCAISAFGQDGPRSGRAAHDLALEALTGVLGANQGNDGQPAMPALPLSDYLSALNGLSAVLMALYARERTGRGDFIDISMQEALLSATANVLGPTLAEGRQPVIGHERTTGGAAFYRCYACGDGEKLALAGQEPKFIAALLGHLGRSELVPLCDTPGPHQQPVVDTLAAFFASHTLAEAGALLDRIDVCWGRVNTYPQALEDEQIAARGFVLTDDLGRRHLGPPIRFADEPARVTLRAPALGEHQDLARKGW